jgi:hypothetical protein
MTPVLTQDSERRCERRRACSGASGRPAATNRLARRTRSFFLAIQYSILTPATLYHTQSRYCNITLRQLQSNALLFTVAAPYTAEYTGLHETLGQSSTWSGTTAPPEVAQQQGGPISSLPPPSPKPILSCTQKALHAFTHPPWAFTPAFSRENLVRATQA